MNKLKEEWTDGMKMLRLMMMIRIIDEGKWRSLIEKSYNVSCLFLAVLLYTYHHKRQAKETQDTL